MITHFNSKRLYKKVYFFINVKKYNFNRGDIDRNRSHIIVVRFLSKKKRRKMSEDLTKKKRTF